jgi:ribosomal protein L7/L12
MSGARVNKPGPNLGELCAPLSKQSTPAFAAAAFVAVVVALTGFIYFALWTADAFPILPGPPLISPTTRFVISAIMGLVGTLASVLAFRNRKNHLLREAERLASSGEQIRAARVLNQATELGLEECARLIEASLTGRQSSAALRTLPVEVQQLAEAGQQLQAVERLRKLTGVGLPEAMRLVEEHLGMRPWWQELAADPNQKIGAIAAYREEHDVDLASAAEAVEEYIKNRRP